ncbi:type II toxin-antitoxin system prevent-host-death family antitoxin [Corticibacterium sp. UT-5YL-CI-8]|nr:type II toxin-antitoxin system prevent-host-death family antitoxin [Tianweitania sp. UT-5YL-CI-8]
MRTVGAFEAKNTLGSLLDLVEQGEEITITRHGKPAARLVSAGVAPDRSEAKAAAARILERAKGRSLGGISIKELIEDGRR